MCQVLHEIYQTLNLMNITKAVFAFDNGHGHQNTCIAYKKSL